MQSEQHSNRFIVILLLLVAPRIDCRAGTGGLIKDIIESISSGVSCMTKTLSLGPEFLNNVKTRRGRNSDLRGSGCYQNYDPSNYEGKTLSLGPEFLNNARARRERNSDLRGSGYCRNYDSSNYERSGALLPDVPLMLTQNQRVGCNCQNGGYTSHVEGCISSDEGHNVPTGGFTSEIRGYNSWDGDYCTLGGGCNSQIRGYPQIGVHPRTGYNHQSPSFVSTPNVECVGTINSYTPISYEGNCGQRNGRPSGQCSNLLGTPNMVCREEIDQDTQTKVIVCDTCYDSEKITGGQYPCGCSGAKYTQDYQFGSCCYSQQGQQGLGNGYQFGSPRGEGEICQCNCPPSRQPSCQIDDCQAIGNQGENCQVNRRITLLRNQCDDLDSNNGGGDQLNLHNQLIFNQYNNVIGSVGNCQPSDMACQIGELARNLACGGYDNQCCRTSPGGPSPSLVVALPRNSQCIQDNQCSPRDQIPQVVQFVASRPQSAVGGCPVPCTPRGPNFVILANTCFPTKGQPFVSSPQG